MKFYVAHWYRGPDGDNADPITIQENIDNVVALAHTMRLYYPEHEFYVPHTDSEIQAYEDEGTKAVLEACGRKVVECDVLILVGSMSAGMEFEERLAKMIGLPIVVLAKINSDGWEQFVYDVNDIVGDI